MTPFHTHISRSEVGVLMQELRQQITSVEDT
jgi:hypothetical protein